MRVSQRTPCSSDQRVVYANTFKIVYDGEPTSLPVVGMKAPPNSATPPAGAVAVPRPAGPVVSSPARVSPQASKPSG